MRTVAVPLQLLEDIVSTLNRAIVEERSHEVVLQLAEEVDSLKKLLPQDSSFHEPDKKDAIAE
jgi:hypothetical protein